MAYIFLLPPWVCTLTTQTYNVQWMCIHTSYQGRIRTSNLILATLTKRLISTVLAGKSAQFWILLSYSSHLFLCALVIYIYTICIHIHIYTKVHTHTHPPTHSPHSPHTYPPTYTLITHIPTHLHTHHTHTHPPIHSPHSPHTHTHPPIHSPHSPHTHTHPPTHWQSQPDHFRGAGSSSSSSRSGGRRGGDLPGTVSGKRWRERGVPPLVTTSSPSSWAGYLIVIHFL